jgi:hypothetical protein
MSWRRRTATGAILSGLALGFQQVFEDNKPDIPIIVQTSGDPPTDLPVEAELEELAPRRSVVKIRPWLLGEGDEQGATGEAPGEGAVATEAAATDSGATDPGATDPEATSPAGTEREAARPEQ